MNNLYKILMLILLIASTSCNLHGTKKKSTNVVNDTVKINSPQSQAEIEPRIVYIAYGSYCGECGYDCTKIYKHYLIGNTTTFWTDKTDSYFSDSGLKFETKMSRESEKYSFELINNIPKLVLETKSSINNFGCPDCDDGCGLYFEFQLDEPNSKPIIYNMEYGLNGTTGKIKEFGEKIKSTIKELENYR